MLCIYFQPALIRASPNTMHRKGFLLPRATSCYQQLTNVQSERSILRRIGGAIEHQRIAWKKVDSRISVNSAKRAGQTFYGADVH